MSYFNKILNWLKQPSVERDLTLWVVTVAGIIVLVSTFIYYYSVTYLAEKDLDTQMDQAGATLARGLSKIMADQDYNAAEQYLRDFIKDSPFCYSLSLENSSGRNIFYFEHHDMELNSDGKILEIPILFDQEVQGFAKLAVNSAEISLFKKNAKVYLAAFFLAIILGVFFTARTYANRLMKDSVRFIQAGLNVFSGGDTAYRIAPVRYHDIQPLVHEINAVAQQISDRTVQLEKEVIERRRTEIELLDSRRQMFTLLQNLPGMAYRCRNDEDFTMEFVSQGIKRLTGYDADQILLNRDISFDELIHPEDRKKVHDAVRDAVDNNQHFEMEYRIQTASDEIKMVWEQGVGLVENPDEDPILEGFIMDITSRYNAEEELKKLNQELERRIEARTADLEVSNRALRETLKLTKETQQQLVESEKLVALGSMVAGVAHEINNPLGISITAASHLEQKLKDLSDNILAELDPKNADILGVLVESLQIVQSNLKRASDLVTGFKKVAVDQSMEERRIFNLKDYLNDVMIGLWPELKKAIINVSVKCPEDLEIESYPGPLSQIITNLVLNSVRHGFEGRKKGAISIEVIRTARALSIVYKDDGKGIPAEMISKIFDPFYTTARAKGGSGLGLHIVYNIVTNTFKGTIQCESGQDKGTTFTIQIPFSELGFGA